MKIKCFLSNRCRPIYETKTVCLTVYNGLSLISKEKFKIKKRSKTTTYLKKCECDFHYFDI